MQTYTIYNIVTVQTDADGWVSFMECEFLLEWVHSINACLSTNQINETKAIIKLNTYKENDINNTIDELYFNLTDYDHD